MMTLPSHHANKYFIFYIIVMDNNLIKYLSTVPVVAFIWLTFTAGLIIEINRFFPDLLYFYL